MTESLIYSEAEIMSYNLFHMPCSKNWVSKNSGGGTFILVEVIAAREQLENRQVERGHSSSYYLKTMVKNQWERREACWVNVSSSIVFFVGYTFLFTNAFLFLLCLTAYTQWQTEDEISHFITVPVGLWAWVFQFHYLRTGEVHTTS